MDQRIPKNNNPENAMSSKDDVQSNDRKMKQDFPGYPHHPASEDALKEDKNERTDFRNESDTTATGSESVRESRPTKEENKISGKMKSEEANEWKKGNDRGLNVHEVDADNPTQ